MSRLSVLHFTKPTGPTHTATVIYFHGSGSHGADMKEWVRLMAKNFAFPHIKVLFPTAPQQAYTPAGGESSNVWFDRAGISIHVPEKLDSIANIEKLVKTLIKDENDAGIPSERIIVGGFSMGGALALHTAYRWDRKVAGAFAFSSFLNDNSIVYKELKDAKGQRLPPLFQAHGDVDDLVPLKWGETTHQLLKEGGVQGDFHVMERVGHSINRRATLMLKAWIEAHLPEL